MKVIYCTNGATCSVDDEDFPLLSRHTWYQNNSGYATTEINRNRILMHRLVFGPVRGKYLVDHKDQNKLNNQKTNLRIASKQENSINCKHRKNSKTGYRGVRELNGRYQAYTTYNGKQVSFGVYDTAELAARARDSGMLGLHGPDFVALNFLVLGGINGTVLKLS
jgi:hypothetical protein